MRIDDLLGIRFCSRCLLRASAAAAAVVGIFETGRFFEAARFQTASGERSLAPSRLLGGAAEEAEAGEEAEASGVGRS